MTKLFQTPSDAVQLNTVYMTVNRFLMEVGVTIWFNVQSSGPDCSPYWDHFVMFLGKTLNCHRVSLFLRGKSDRSLFFCLWVPYSLWSYCLRDRGYLQLDSFWLFPQTKHYIVSPLFPGQCWFSGVTDVSTLRRRQEIERRRDELKLQEKEL